MEPAHNVLPRPRQIVLNEGSRQPKGCVTFGLKSLNEGAAPVGVSLRLEGKHFWNVGFDDLHAIPNFAAHWLYRDAAAVDTMPY